MPVMTRSMLSAQPKAQPEEDADDCPNNMRLERANKCEAFAFVLAYTIIAGVSLTNLILSKNPAIIPAVHAMIHSVFSAF